MSFEAGIDVGNERPGQHAGLARADGLGLRVRADEPLVALLGAGVVGAALGRAGEHGAQGVHERLLLGPALVQNDDLAGVAVEPAVVAHLGGEVLGVELHVGLRPGPGHDDDRGDVAELAGDALVDAGFVLALRSAPSGPTP
jgi:hypothetical protein